MKYMKGLGLAAQIGFAIVAFLFCMRVICGLFALMIPVLDAVLAWMYNHALVGGLTLAIGFLLFWFGEECERAIRRERMK